jgi:flagellar motor protein MotB
VSSSRIAIDGRGSREPIADNATETGRARNRRIDIFLAERSQR